MDGFAPTLGVVVIAASNRPDILDPALLRPGRFDRHVALEPPDAEGRLEILDLHAATRRLAADADLEAIAKLTPGTSGADLANLLNEAALLTVRRKGQAIEQDDLLEAVDRVLAGPRRQGRLLTPAELERLAYHEAGHAVVAADVDFPAEVHRLSVVARGRDGAHTGLASRTDRSVLTRSELLDELTITVAGAAAEILSTGEPSTAIEADLEQATDIARRFAGRYGMSEEVGRIRVLHADAEVFLGRELAGHTTVSGETQQVVDRAVKKLIADAEKRALTILQRRRADLDRIAAALVEHESLDADEIASLLNVRRRTRAKSAAARRSASS